MASRERSSDSALSRRLSYVLRHAPRSVGLVLDPGGWVEVSALVAAMRRAGADLTEERLAAIVAHDQKQRYRVEGTRIRASQGHTVPVDLGLVPVEPPAVLYHGTVARALAEIRREGLLPRGRHHVHLSRDVATARAVGARRGRPVVLEVDSAAMWHEGAEFFRSANGVWLVDGVPPGRLRVVPG